MVVQGQGNARASDSDIHFGARNETQVRIGRASHWPWKLQADQQFVRLEDIRPDAGKEILARHPPGTPRTGYDANARSDDDGRNGVARGR